MARQIDGFVNVDDITILGQGQLQYPSNKIRVAGGHQSTREQLRSVEIVNADCLRGRAMALMQGNERQQMHLAFLACHQEPSPVVIEAASAFMRKRIFLMQFLTYGQLVPHRGFLVGLESGAVMPSYRHVVLGATIDECDKVSIWRSIHLMRLLIEYKSSFRR